MTKKIIFNSISILTAILMFISTNIVVVKAETTTGLNREIVSNTMLRVGLEEVYEHVSSFTVKNKSIKIGHEIDGVFSSIGTFTDLGSLKIVADTNLYVDSGVVYGSYKDAYVASGGKNIVVYSSPKTWKVYYNGFASTEAAKAKGTLVSPNPRRALLTNSKGDLMLYDYTYANMQIQSGDDEFINLGERRYRGRIEVYIYENKTITPVNVLKVDEYLYSVVASEMPSTWHIEAIKAQAVAARDYTMTRKGIHSEDGYDICDVVHCQMYKGAGNEAESTRRAVNETSGILAYYNGEIINAVYHSTSGGSTENSENVWTQTIPYLRGVSDKYETETKSWTREYTLGDFTYLAEQAGFGIGSITKILVYAETGSGRCTRLDLVGTGGTKSIKKDAVRSFFGYGARGSLMSTNFKINGITRNIGTETPQTSAQIVEPTSDNALVYVASSFGVTQVPLSQVPIINEDEVITTVASPTIINLNPDVTHISSSNATVTTSNTQTITLTGNGWGHGVGLSQYGAKGMAESGFTFDKILKFYYTGVEVK